MISHRHRCIFTHVPKTAGKSILAAFGLPMLGRDYAHDIPYIEHPYGHVPLSYYRRAPAYSYFKFAFVRNPWDRLVSAFSYLDAGGCNEEDAQFRATHLAVYNGSFKAFVHDIDRHLVAQHFCPQTSWLCDENGALLPDFIGRHERLQADFHCIATRLSLPPLLNKLNPSQHTHYREYFDRTTREIVERVYRRDIEAFGYEY